MGSKKNNPEILRTTLRVDYSITRLLDYSITRFGDKFSKLIPWLLSRGIIEYTGRQNDWARCSLIVEEVNTYNYDIGTEQSGRREKIQDIMLMLEMSKSYDVSNDTFPDASDPDWSYYYDPSGLICFDPNSITKENVASASARVCR